MKLKLEAEKFFLASRAKKHNVSMTGYPLSYYKDDQFLYLIQCGFMVGEEKDKKALEKDIRKSKELVKLERNGDFALLITKQPLFTEPVYDPRIIRPSPVIFHKEGYLIWELASFDKNLLTKVFEFGKKYFDAKLLKMEEEKISNISITRLFPKLTQKQKQALGLAIQHGYYDYPRKIQLKQLAKMMKIAYSTFQFHLRKAEGKIIPDIYKSL